MNKKPKQDKFTPQQREFLRALELAILELPRSDKQNIFDCWQNNTTPPDHLREYCKAFFDAVSLSPKIADVLKQPRSIVITKEHAENQTPQQRADNERFIIDRIAFFKVTSTEARQYVKAAIIDKEQGAKLTEEEKYILANVLAVLKIAEHNAAILQSIFNLSNQQINAAIKEAKQAEYIALPIAEDETGALTYGGAESSPSLPGLEEKTETIKEQMPLTLPAPVDYAKNLLKTTSKFNRNIGFYTNTDDVAFQLDKPATTQGLQASKRRLQFSITHCKSDAGELITLTPYDQEIENTISNLFQELSQSTAAEVTSEMIYRRMNGIQDARRKVTPAALKLVDETIEKLRTTDVTIRFIQKNKDENGNETEQETDKITGHILDVFHRTKGLINKKNRIVPTWVITRPGALFMAEQKQNRLVAVKPSLLDLTSSGVSITPLTVSIRKFIIDEIFRISIAPSYETHKNIFKFDRLLTYDRAPELTEQSAPDEMGRITYTLKQGKTATEKKRIREAIRFRIERAQDILEHFKKNGALNDWYFLDSEENKIAYQIKAKVKAPKEKERVYKPGALALIDSVFLDVNKTSNTINRIANIQYKNEAADRNKRKTQKEQEKKQKAKK